MKRVGNIPFAHKLHTSQIITGRYTPHPASSPALSRGVNRHRPTQTAPWPEVVVLRPSAHCAAYLRSKCWPLTPEHHATAHILHTATRPSPKLTPPDAPPCPTLWLWGIESRDYTSGLRKSNPGASYSTKPPRSRRTEGAPSEVIAAVTRGSPGPESPDSSLRHEHIRDALEPPLAHIIRVVGDVAVGRGFVDRDVPRNPPVRQPPAVTEENQAWPVCRQTPH